MAAQLAEPFIRLTDYLRWVVGQGCTITTGVLVEPDEMVTYTVITAESGRHVVIHNVGEDEAIPGSAYKYYDRRLGLKPDDPLYGAGDSAILPFTPER